jgi:hypothetical protein
MKRGFFSFWWCIAFALLSLVALRGAIGDENVLWTWIDSIMAGLWLFFAWIEKKIDALEAQTGEGNDRQGD